MKLTGMHTCVLLRLINTHIVVALVSRTKTQPGRNELNNKTGAGSLQLSENVKLLCTCQEAKFFIKIHLYRYAMVAKLQRKTRRFLCSSRIHNGSLLFLN